MHMKSIEGNHCILQEWNETGAFFNGVEWDGLMEFRRSHLD